LNKPTFIVIALLILLSITSCDKVITITTPAWDGDDLNSFSIGTKVMLEGYVVGNTTLINETPGYEVNPEKKQEKSYNYKYNYRSYYILLMDNQSLPEIGDYLKVTAEVKSNTLIQKYPYSSYYNILVELNRVNQSPPPK
jgi:hypothetical protein